jgi:hypothetical protein
MHLKEDVDIGSGVKNYINEFPYIDTYQSRGSYPSEVLRVGIQDR